VQFHPTALALKGERPFLITEAVRGVGAILMTEAELNEWRAAKKTSPGVEPAELSEVGPAELSEVGPAELSEVGPAELSDVGPAVFSFLGVADPRGSLATRDIVARAADAEMKRSGESHVLLVTEHLDGEMLVEKFPTIAKRIGTHGLVFGRDPIPVAPAAHYIVGGLAVNEWGEVWQRDLAVDDPTFSSRTDRAVTGLYAIGEAACTGLHGANRLASNSLLEAVVFSNRAGERVIESLSRESMKAGAGIETDSELPDWRAEGLADLEEHAPLVHDRQQLRSTMSDDVGLVKSDWRLSRAERRLALLDDEVDRIWQRCLPSNELVELRNMVLLGRLVIAASKARKNNVGLHYNLDNIDNLD
jgi:L-aspartate oxidase